MAHAEWDPPVIDTLCSPGASRAGPAQDAADSDTDAAVERLFAAHYGGLVRLARVLVDDLASAEDVAQDAFVALHRRWGRLRDEARAVDYLRSSVLNGARDRLRRRRVARAHEADLREPGATAPDLAERHETADLMITTLRELPRRQREVLVLRYYLDLTEDEIAATLGVSAGSVKRHASRGLAALKARLVTR